MAPRLLQRTGGVTPHQKATVEAYRADPAKTFEDLFRVVDRDRDGFLIPFRPNRLQAKFLAELDFIEALRARENMGGQLKLICLKQRRGGMSAGIMGLAYRRLNFWSFQRAVCIAHREKTAKQMNGFARVFYDYWPMDDAHAWLRASYTAMSDSKIALENGSTISFETAKGLEPRGGEATFIFATEFAHYDAYAAFLALLQQASPHATIIKESTANGPGGAFYDEWTDAMWPRDVERAYAEKDWETLRRWNGHFRFFFPWHEDPGYVLPVQDGEREAIFASLDAVELELVEQFGLGAEQLKWRREKIKDMGHHEALSPIAYFQQEYPSTPEEAFQGSGATFFDADALRLQVLQAERTPPLARFYVTDRDLPRRVSSGGNLLVWKLPEEGHDYVLGGDYGHGLPEGDFTVLPVFDRLDGTALEQVAEYRGRSPATAAGDLTTMLAELYNGAFVIPEYQGPGMVACERVIANRYARVYHRKSHGQVADQDDTNGFFYGFLTGTGTRSQGKRVLCEGLRSDVRHGTCRVRSVDTLREMQVFRDVEGELTAPEGKHDDGVIAVALAARGQLEAGPLRRYKRKLGSPLASADASIHAAVKERKRKYLAKNKRELAKTVARLGR